MGPYLKIQHKVALSLIAFCVLLQSKECRQKFHWPHSFTNNSSDIWIEANKKISFVDIDDPSKNINLKFFPACHFGDLVYTFKLVGPCHADFASYTNSSANIWVEVTKKSFLNILGTFVKSPDFFFMCAILVIQCGHVYKMVHAATGKNVCEKNISHLTHLCAHKLHCIGLYIHIWGIFMHCFAPYVCLLGVHTPCIVN